MEIHAAAAGTLDWSVAGDYRTIHGIYTSTYGLAFKTPLCVNKGSAEGTLYMHMSCYYYHHRCSAVACHSRAVGADSMYT